MTRIVLVQPPAGARISGGYLYNAQLARHGALALRDAEVTELPALLEHLEADLLLADSIFLTEAAFGPFLARALRGQRVGVMMHSFPSMIAAAERGELPCHEPTPFERAALSAVGLAVMPGPFYADMLANDPVRVVVCEPGLDDERRHPPRDRAGQAQLVALGAVTRLKGFLDVIEALEPRAQVADFQLTICGSESVDPTYAQRVREAAQRVGGVSLAGQVSPDRAANLLARADLLVMPSYSENHPLVLLEALAASVPSVAYAAGAAAALVQNGVEGLLVEVGDRAALTRALEALLDDEPRRRRMADACWERQSALPTWAEAARRAHARLCATL